MTVGQVVQDVYVWLLAAVMLTSMLVSVLVNVSHLSDRACTAADCSAARNLLPWIVVGATLAGLWGMARLLGPVAVSPGIASWLLSTPVDRGELLRRRVASTVGLAAVATSLIAAAVATLAGFDLHSVLLFTLGSAGLAACGVGALVLAQPHRRHPALLLGPLCLVAVATGLAVIAAERAPDLAHTSALLGVGLAVTVALWGVTGSLLLSATRLTGRLRRRQVAPGGALLPGLGGALSSLDLALMFDVLVAHTSRARGVLRVVRGGPGGVLALAWRDVIRLRRNPGKVMLLVGSLLVPYAVAGVGGGIVTLAVEVMVCFFFVLPMLVSLRVLTRSSGMVRTFPTRIGPTRAAALVVPGLLVVVHGLLSAPAVHHTMDGAWSEMLLLGVATGVGGLAAAARWVTGRPPDYGRPLVTSPAGGVPTNLYGSVLRGFDVALLAVLPMLFFPTDNGALFALLLSGGVLTYLCGRK